MFKKLLFIIFLLFTINNVYAEVGVTKGTSYGDAYSVPADSTPPASPSGGGTPDPGVQYKCDLDNIGNVGDFLEGCKPNSVAGGVSNMKVEGGFKEKMNSLIKNISLVLGFLAVGVIVYAGLLMQFSGGEDDKVKKGKNIVKWSIIGFTLLISASGIIYILINFIFSL